MLHPFEHQHLCRDGDRIQLGTCVYDGPLAIWLLTQYVGAEGVDVLFRHIVLVLCQKNASVMSLLLFDKNSSETLRKFWLMKPSQFHDVHVYADGGSHMTKTWTDPIFFKM